MKNAPLSAKQELYVKHYLIEMNAMKAARLAGYSDPKNSSYSLMKNATVTKAIASNMDARNKRLDINADWVLSNLHCLYQRVTQEVKPALNSKTGKPITDEDGNALFTFNANAALKAIELMGKHIDVNAFSNNLNVNVSRDEQLIEHLIQSRKAMQEGREDDE